MNLAAIDALHQSQAERIDKIRSVAPDIRAEAPPVVLDGTTARVRIYQAIDDWGEWWGLSANELADAIDALPSNIDTIELSIHSPGGFVFESIAILNALRRHKAKVVAVIDGLAASAASFIAASADETWMMPNSTMMVHAPWGFIRGNAKDLREYADILDDILLNMCDIYAAKSGESAEEWLERLAPGEDIYYTAAEAVEAGLADGVLTSTTDDDPEDGASNSAGATASVNDETEPEAVFDPSLTLALLDL